MASALVPETIDLSTLVTALESLLSLSGKQRQQEIELQNEANGETPNGRPSKDAAGSNKGDEQQVGLEKESELLEKERQETESHIKRKLIEIHCRLKNGSVPWDEDEDMGEEVSRLSFKERQAELSNRDRHELEIDVDDDDDDEGAVIDPSPSPQIQPAPAKGHEVIAPAKESATAIISQCLTVFDPVQKFSNETKALSAQLLAELAKTEVGRQLCLQHTVKLESSEEPTYVVKSVAQILSPDSPLETTVQVCRILANLCYNCEEGRKQILKNRVCLQMLYEIAKGREYRAKSGEDPGQRLPAILPGFLLNFCNETADSIKAIGELGFLDVIMETILATKTNDAVFNNCLLFLNCLMELKASHDYFTKCLGLTDALSHIMEHTTSPEVTESALELMLSLTTKIQSMALAIAKSNLCDLMITRVEGRWKDGSGEFSEHRKTACNVIVLVLSDDESIDLAFSSKDSVPYCEKFIEWLKVDEEEVQVCACLCIGNFANGEPNCMTLVSNGSSEAIIRMLNSPSISPLTRQAGLSAAKNLVVSARARKVMIEQGVLDPCMDIAMNDDLFHSHASIMKLYGTLRLCSTANPDAVKYTMAYRQGEGKRILAKIVDLATADQPPQFTEELTRYIAVILKNCEDHKVIRRVIECGGLPPVVMMLHSRHGVMLNEALTALTVMAAVMISTKDEEGFSYKDQVVRQLHTDAVINGVKTALKSATVPVEIKSNCLVFVRNLLMVNTDSFKEMLASMHFKSECLNEEALKSLPPEFASLAEEL